MEINLGDKVWFKYGPSTMITGYFIDHTPNMDWIAVSPVNYENFCEMNLTERGQVPQHWCEVKFCSAIDKISRQEIKELDEKLSKSMNGVFQPRNK